MARTFRRTRDRQFSYRYERDTVPARSKHGGTYWTEVDLTPDDPTYRWNWLYVHTDSHPGTWNAPGWFRRSMNRHFRQEARQRLFRQMHAVDGEVLLLPFRKNANWIWF